MAAAVSCNGQLASYTTLGCAHSEAPTGLEQCLQKTPTSGTATNKAIHQCAMMTRLLARHSARDSGSCHRSTVAQADRPRLRATVSAAQPHAAAYRRRRCAMRLWSAGQLSGTNQRPRALRQQWMDSKQRPHATCAWVHAWVHAWVRAKAGAEGTSACGWVGCLGGWGVTMLIVEIG